MDGDAAIDTETPARDGIGCLPVLIRLGMGAFVVSLVLAVFLAYEIREARGKLSAVEVHLEANLEALPTALRSTLADRGAGNRISPDELPHPLRAPGVIFARIGDEHVTLVVTANPDTDCGFRVWLDKQADDYQDRETNLPGVYRYSYCDDFEPSPTNQPW